MIYELRFRGDFGAVTSGQLYKHGSNRKINEDMELISYDSVTFLVHGFNVSESDGRKSLSKLARDLSKHHSGAFVYVLWPGDSPIGPLSYPFTEGNQAIDTAAELAKSICQHVPDKTHSNFVGHSLGCRVILETLERLREESVGRKNIYPVSQVCLMAAATDDYCLAAPSNYKDAVERVNRVAVLSSTEDNVLKYIYPLGDLVQSFIFFWKESFGFALGYAGPRDYIEYEDYDDDIHHYTPSNVAPVAIDASLGVDHGDYLPGTNNPNPDEVRKQSAATKFAGQILAGSANVHY